MVFYFKDIIGKGSFPSSEIPGDQKLQNAFPHSLSLSLSPALFVDQSLHFNCSLALIFSCCELCSPGILAARN